MNELHDFIQQQLPQSWTLSNAELFSVHDQQGAISFSLESCRQTSPQQIQAVFADGELELTLSISANATYRALTASITLHNKGATRTFTRIDAMLLRWDSAEQPLYVKNCSGGTNEHHYPPQAFREQCVRADDSAFLWMENGFDGRSSNAHLPLMSVCNGDTAVSGGLAWSGLWWMYGNGTGNGSRSIGCHIPIQNLILEPNEKLELPTAHYVFSQGGLDGASNAIRRYIRESVAAQTTQTLEAQPVYNHWFGIGPDINAAVFKQQCDRAKAYGISYVVLDAGWYGGCSETNFSSGVGNWNRIDTNKFPDGVEDVSNYAKNLGLKFGLWFEVERAHRDSDWAKEHPEWFFDIGAEYLHIDMSNNKAVDACIQLVQDAIDRYDCQWLKLDYNIGPRPYWDHKDPSGKIQFQYVAGLYRFFQSIRQRNPQVVLENCASGGRRIDLGTISQTHVQNLTDQTSSAAICRFMMHGAQSFLPANICPIGMPFGNKESHSIADEHINAFHLLSRFTGLPTLYGDIASSGDKTQELIKQITQIHREYAEVFMGDFFRLSAQAMSDREYEAVAHLSPDQSRGIVLLFSGHEDMQQAPHLCIDTLLTICDYKVSTLLQSNKELNQISGIHLSELHKHIEKLPAQTACLFCLRR